MFKFKFSCGRKRYHTLSGYLGLAAQRHVIKCALKFWIARLAALRLWRCGGNNWYLIFERLRNQRPTLVVPPDVSTSVKEIWIGNVLLLETFLVKFLPAPEPFRRKDALGWVWGFLYIYL